MEKTTATDLPILLENCLAQSASRNLRPLTIESYRVECTRFLIWLELHHGVHTADRLRLSHIDAWLRYLSNYRTRFGLPLSIKTQRTRVATLRTFFRYLALRGYILSRLLDALIAPKEPQTLPLSVLNHAQVKKLLARIQTNHGQGVRDRAILELLYSSGIRSCEVLALDLGDIDLYASTAKISGKGGKERMVPIGQSALRWIESYIQGVRPFARIKDPQEQGLFISYRGTRLKYSGLRRIVHIHSNQLDFEVHVSAHTFRRSCTTELIRGGANMYHVKELLGHESLETLKPYTKLTIQDLKKTHEKTHPRERDLL